MLSRVSMEGVTRLVVTPNVRFGQQAEDAGLIGDDEVWVPYHSLANVRGYRFESWRYLDTLDTPPPPGSAVDVVEAWLAREDHPFPPLSAELVVQLDTMVMFAAP